MPKNENFPKGVHIRCQEKGWMTEELVIDWITTVWCRRPGALLARQSMLVLDAFRGHLTEGVKKKLQEEATDLVVIPGGMTSQLQRLDVCLNKPFKDLVRRLRRNGLDTVGPFEACISVGSGSLDSRRLGSYTRRYGGSFFQEVLHFQLAGRH